MIKKKSKNIELTARDIKLFRLLFEYKIATLKKIQKHCFKSAGRDTTRQRLAKLEKLGCIESNWSYSGGYPCKIFSLTKTGKECVSTYYKKNNSHFQLKSECREHDLVLLDIGQRLSSKESAAEYLTENILQSNKEFREHSVLKDFVEINSDAYLKLAGPKKRYHMAVEFENSVQKKKKYERLVNDYYLAEKIDGVFYFYKNKRVREIIGRFEEELWPKRRPKFYFCQVEDGQDWSKKITLANRKGLTVRV